jgi:hypothetical protein
MLASRQRNSVTPWPTAALALGKLEELARRLVSGDMAFSFFGSHRSSNARARALEAMSNSA